MAKSREEREYLRELEQGPQRPMRRAIPRVRSSAGGGGLNVTVNRAAGQGNPVNAGPINFTVTFSEAATGFTNSDVSFAGSTVGGTPAAAVTGGPAVFNVAVTGMTGDGLVSVTIPSASATSTAKGTPFPASTTATVTFDTTQPSVTINQAAGQSDPTGTSPIIFTAVFSEAVFGFDGTDITITGTAGGTKAAAVTGGPATYTVSITGMTTLGTVIAAIPANAASDAAGNLSLASTSTDNTVNWDPSVVAGGQLDFSQAAQSGLQTLVLLEDI